MDAYEIATVVHDARIDVDPSLNGQRGRVIILSSGAEAPVHNIAPTTVPRDRLLALQSQFISPPYEGQRSR